MDHEQTNSGLKVSEFAASPIPTLLLNMRPKGQDRRSAPRRLITSNPETNLARRWPTESLAYCSLPQFSLWDGLRSQSLWIPDERISHRSLAILTAVAFQSAVVGSMRSFLCCTRPTFDCADLHETRRSTGILVLLNVCSTEHDAATHRTSRRDCRNPHPGPNAAASPEVQ